MSFFTSLYLDAVCIVQIISINENLDDCNRRKLISSFLSPSRFVYRRIFLAMDIYWNLFFLCSSSFLFESIERLALTRMKFYCFLLTWHHFMNSSFDICVYRRGSDIFFWTFIRFLFWAFIILWCKSDTDTEIRHTSIGDSSIWQVFSCSIFV